MVAVYLCETDETKIERMSFVFFNNILHQLNRRLRYDAAVGYAGNSFFSESNKLIEEANPLAPEKGGKEIASYGSQMAAFLSMQNVEVVKRSKEDEDEYGIVFG